MTMATAIASRMTVRALKRRDDFASAGVSGALMLMSGVSVDKLAPSEPGAPGLVSSALLETRDQAVIADSADARPSQKPDQNEDGVCSQLEVQPVAGQRSGHRRNEEDEADLREQGKVGAQPRNVVHR